MNKLLFQGQVFHKIQKAEKFLFSGRDDDSTVSSILSGLETMSLGLNTLGIT